MAARSGMAAYCGTIQAEGSVIVVTTQDLLERRAAAGASPLCGMPPQVSVIPHDERLAIQRTLAGELDAFNTLVLKHQRAAYGIAFRMLQSREAAADVVQDSFLKAFRAIHSLRGDSFKGWLLRIVTNTCYDMLRQEHEQCHVSISEEADCDDVPLSPRPLTASEEPLHAFVERMELRAHIELGIRTLPHEQRLVIVMHDIHGFSYEEISEITGCLMGTVKSRIYRARHKLRTFLLGKPELLR